MSLFGAYQLLIQICDERANTARLQRNAAKLHHDLADFFMGIAAGYVHSSTEDFRKWFLAGLNCLVCYEFLREGDANETG